jgi:hypothetical protein
LNPTNSDAQQFTTNATGLPIGGIQTIAGTNYLVLTVKRPIGRVAISYLAEVSNDLLNWSPAVLSGTPGNNGDGTETLTFRDTVPANGPGPRFIRLKVQAL